MKCFVPLWIWNKNHEISMNAWSLVSTSTLQTVLHVLSVSVVSERATAVQTLAHPGRQASEPNMLTLMIRKENYYWLVLLVFFFVFFLLMLWWFFFFFSASQRQSLHETVLTSKCWTHVPNFDCVFARILTQGQFHKAEWISEYNHRQHVLQYEDSYREREQLDHFDQENHTCTFARLIARNLTIHPSTVSSVKQPID